MNGSNACDRELVIIDCVKLEVRDKIAFNREFVRIEPLIHAGFPDKSLAVTLLLDSQFCSVYELSLMMSLIINRMM